MRLLLMLAWLLLPAVATAQPVEPPPIEPIEPAVQPPARVEVALPDCASVALDVARLVELLRIELGSDGVEEVVLAAAAPASPPEGSPVALVRIDADPCAAGSLRFRIAIDDLATRKHVERELDLADVEEPMRARVLALSAAELLRASWAELLLGSAPAPGDPSGSTLALRDAMRVRLAASSALTAPPVASSGPRRPPPPAAEEPEPPAFLVDAALAIASFPGARTSLLGASVGFEARLVEEPRLSLRVDAQFGVGSSLDPLGRIDLGFAGGGVALRISLARPSFMVGVGPRLLAGWGWAQGKAYAEDTIASDGGTAVIVATIEAAGAVRIAGRLWATLALEAGGTLRGLQALVASIPVAGVDGSLIGARLGLALRL